MASHERKVILIGDAGVGKSSLLAIRRGYRPFRKYSTYFTHGSFEQSVTDLDLGWWEGAGLLKTTQTMRTTLKRRRLKSIRHTRLQVHNVNPGVTFARFLPHCCYPVATLVLCFSIGDERSFENIKNKVNWASLNNPLGLRSRDLTCWFGQWYPMIRHFLPGVPMLLLGTKSDLRGHAHHFGVLGTNEGTQVNAETRSVVSEQRARRMAQALGIQGYLECSAKEDTDSVDNLFKVLAITSLGYTGSDQTHRPGYGQCGGSTSAWKNFFSMLVTHN